MLHSGRWSASFHIKLNQQCSKSGLVCTLRDLLQKLLFPKDRIQSKVGDFASKIITQNISIEGDKEISIPLSMITARLYKFYTTKYSYDKI